MLPRNSPVTSVIHSCHCVPHSLCRVSLAPFDCHSVYPPPKTPSGARKTRRMERVSVREAWEINRVTVGKSDNEPKEVPSTRLISSMDPSVLSL